MADDCVYKTKEDRFFKAYVELINKLYPDNPMRKVPYDHEIFHIYYDFKNGAPHAQGVPHGMYGLFEPGTGRIESLSALPPSAAAGGSSARRIGIKMDDGTMQYVDTPAQWVALGDRVELTADGQIRRN